MPCADADDPDVIDEHVDSADDTVAALRRKAHLLQKQLSHWKVAALDARASAKRLGDELCEHKVPSSKFSYDLSQHYANV